MKYFFNISVLLLAFFVFTGTPFKFFDKPINSIFHTELRVLSSGTTEIEVAIADNQKTRRMGLSNIDSIPQNRGLFFVFMDSGKHGIWMKDMNFPIDIIWLDNSLRVVDIHEEISVDTYPVSFHPLEPAKFAVEVNAGFSKKHNIKIGDIYSLSAF